MTMLIQTVFAIGAAVLATAGPVSAQVPQPDALGDQIQVLEQVWALGGADNLLVLKVKLKNRGDRPLKDFVFHCVAVSNSGTILNNVRHTLYEALNPGQTKMFYGVTMGLVNTQIAQAGCGVISAAAKN